MQGVAKGKSMSIWQDKQGRTHVGIMVEGQRIHRIMPEGTTAGDAKLAQAELRAALVKNPKQVRIPGDMPMMAALTLYEAHAKHLRSEVSSMHHARRLSPWAKRYKASQASEFAQHFTRDTRAVYAAGTINRSLAIAKKSLSLAWEQGLTVENYGLRIKSLPLNNARHTVLTLEQVKTLSDHASQQVRAAMWISLFTGCRRGEVLSLQPDDIGADSITIRATNTKTLRTRVIPIVAPLRPWLSAVPITINFEGLKSGFNRARIAANMPDVNFHDLRRSCGTMMIQAGVDLYVVSRILGHSTVTVTQAHYAHLQVDTLRAGLDKTFK